MLDSPNPTDIGAASVALRLAIDIAAIAVLALALSYRRHRRRDLVVLYVVFNVGLFAAVVVISAGNVAAAVGFGLFAVLSIIRLRGEPLSHPEIAYFFAAIVLGLVTGIDLDPLASGGLALLVLAVVAFIDHPRLLERDRRMEITLERVFASEHELQRHLEERLAARVVELVVRELDFVREVTQVYVRLADRPAAATATVSSPEPADEGILVLPR